MKQKYAYVTLLTKEDYLDGVIGLHYSLKRVHTQYPLIIMITENIVPALNKYPHKQLIETCNFKIIPHYQFPAGGSYVNKECINKLYAFNFLEYEKLLFLDADTIVLKNLDECFSILSSYEFLAEINTWEDGVRPRICGGNFFFTPDGNKFIDLLNYVHNYKTDIFSDEVAFDKYYYPTYGEDNNYITPQIYADQIICKIYHDGGYPKYWTYLDVYALCNSLFLIEDDKDFEEILRLLRSFSYYLKTHWDVDLNENNS